jgi:hypothetical protein
MQSRKTSILPRRSARFLAAAFLAATASVTFASPPPDCPGNPSAADTQVLRVRIDEARQRTWVLATDGLYVHEHGSAAVPARIRLPGWMHLTRAQACPPAIALGNDGTAMVSSNAVPTLWHIDAGSARVERIEIGLVPGDRRDLGFASLQFAGTDIANATAASDGSRWRIDLRDRIAIPAGR